ncbi:MAG: hypothetical protein V1720_19570 [bacterium]
MKIKIFLISTLLIAFAFRINLMAQSDYEKTQNFKSQHQNVSEAIKGAASLHDLDLAEADIEKLKEDFYADKDLLDKSLYPDNFNSLIEKLRSALQLRKGDFTEIVELETKVDTLRTQISVLNRANASLVVEIREIQRSRKKDAATIAALENLVNKLKTNLQERDDLVRGIMDSLLAEFLKSPGSLNEVEKASLDQKIKSENLFYNIEKTIMDNIQFMRITALKPEDLNEMREEHQDFSKMFRQFGGKLAQVYLETKNVSTEIANVNGLLQSWGNIINVEIWKGVNTSFKEKNVRMVQANSGEEFTQNVVSYIEDEIKNYGVKKKEESVEAFHTFTDSVWFGGFQDTWLKILLDQQLLSEADKDTIEAKIAVWKAKVEPGVGSNLLIYVIVAVAVIGIAALLFALLWKKKAKPIEPTQLPPSEA